MLSESRAPDGEEQAETTREGALSRWCRSGVGSEAQNVTGLLIGLIGGLSKLHAHFEPDVVAFECLLRVDLRRPFQFGRDTGFAELCGVREHRSDAGGHFLEAPQPRPIAAVAGGLRQVETIRADTDEAFAQRQMLCQGGVNVKNLPAMVVRFGVLGV